MKAEPCLELAPYELPPSGRRDDDGQAFFVEATLFGKKRTLVGRSFSEDGYENILCFAVPDEPQRGHFVCAQSLFEDSGDWVYPTLVHSKKDEPEILIERIESQDWGRYFVLDGDLELASEGDGVFCLFLCRDGRAVVLSPRRSSACFRWSPSCAARMWETSYPELLQHVVSSAKESDSVGFPFRWASMSNREHFDLAYPLQCGIYDEWTHVCKLCLLSLDLWEEERESHRLQFSVGLNGEADASWFTSQPGNYKIAPTTPFHKFAQWSSSHFSPTRNDELCNRHSCVEAWARGPIPIVSGSLTRPTQHERLEAGLQLREWLADKATPLEIDQLLRED